MSEETIFDVFNKKPEVVDEGPPTPAPTIWDIVNSITETKVNLLNDPSFPFKKLWNGFVVNRALSAFPDCFEVCQENNKNFRASAEMQYLYLFHSVKKKKRWSKWNKRVDNKYLNAVKKFYNYNDKKALDAIACLSEEQLSAIKERIEIIEGKKK